MKDNFFPRHTRYGERVKGSKLTVARVHAIRRAHKNGITATAMASVFGVNRTTISGVITRRTWSHIKEGI